MSKKVVITLVIIISLVIILTFFIRKYLNIPYESEYIEKTNGMFNVYEKLISMKGQPLMEKSIPLGKGDVALDLYYDGYTLRLLGKDTQYKSNYYVGNLIITDPNYSLGKHKIRVGSTRNEVEKAYRHVKRIVDSDSGYIDGSIWVEFYYNSENKVSSIMIRIAGP